MSNIQKQLENGKLEEYLTLNDFAENEEISTDRLLEIDKYKTLPLRFHPNLSQHPCWFIIKDTSIPDDYDQDEQLPNIYEYIHAMSYNANCNIAHENAHPTTVTNDYVDAHLMFLRILDEYNLSQTIELVTLDKLSDCNYKITPYGLQLLTYKNENLCKTNFASNFPVESTTVKVEFPVLLKEYVNQIIIFIDELDAWKNDTSEEFTKLCKDFEQSPIYKQYGKQVQQTALEKWIMEQGFTRNDARELKARLSKRFGIATLRNK